MAFDKFTNVYLSANVKRAKLKILKHFLVDLRIIGLAKT